MRELTLSERIEEARKRMGWSRRKLADEASAIPGAPASGISENQVQYAEGRRRYVRLKPDEPLIWLCKALRLPDGDEILRQISGKR